MKELTQARLKQILDYDPETGIFVWKVKPSSNMTIGDTAGCIKKGLGYRAIGIDKKQYYEHRLAWFYYHGAWPDKEIDHINQNKLDNSILNLHEAHTITNQRNCYKQSNNTSGFNGVCWDSFNETWIAKIMVIGKSITLKTSINYDVCVAARKAANIKYGFSPNHGRER